MTGFHTCYWPSMAWRKTSRFRSPTVPQPCGEPGVGNLIKRTGGGVNPEFGGDGVTRRQAVAKLTAQILLIWLPRKTSQGQGLP